MDAQLSGGIVVMTELDLREEATEGGLISNLLRAAQPSVATIAENSTPEGKSITQIMSEPQTQENKMNSGKEDILSPQSTTEIQMSEVDLETSGNGSQSSSETYIENSSNDSEQQDSSVPAMNGTSTAETEASFTPVKENDTRPRRLKELQIGMELHGRVTSVALYGIFVDLGVGRDGLVHISEMSDSHIDSPSDLVQIGDTVNVRVKSIDLEARRISLTMRTQRNGEEQNRERTKRAEINREALSNLKVGDIVQGTITGLAPFGAFVDIGVGKDGLVHISELSEQRVDKPEDAVQINHQYTFKLLEIDSEGNRISLSLRRAQRTIKMQQLSPGDIIPGTVSGLAPFGAFVDIGVGRDGLVHISQMSHNRVGKVEDVVKLGDVVSVRVLEVDSQSKRISLTMRLEDPPAEESVEPIEQQAPAPAPTPAPAPAPTPAPTPAPAFQRGEGRRTEGKEGRRTEGKEGRRTEGKEGRQRGGNRGSRSASQPQYAEVPTYVTTGDDTDEEFEGNATLEDLLTKFGNPNTNRKDRRRHVEEDDEDDEERYAHRQRQRDAIRRTLQHLDDEDDK